MKVEPRESGRDRASGCARSSLALRCSATGRAASITVPATSLAVTRVFGAVVDAAVPPGVHWWWPRPIGRVDRVEVTRTFTMPVGYFLLERAAQRTRASVSRKLAHRRHEHPPAPRQGELPDRRSGQVPLRQRGARRDPALRGRLGVHRGGERAAGRRSPHLGAPGPHRARSRARAAAARALGRRSPGADGEPRVDRAAAQRRGRVPGRAERPRRPRAPHLRGGDLRERPAARRARRSGKRSSARH